MNASDASLPASSSDYIFEVWQTDQGLPENSATSMVQTPDGYLWFGTFNGLVRFDGVRFTVFDRSNTPELPSAAIVNLYLDSKARLWVSTLLGLAYVQDGRWRVFHQSDGWVGSYVWRFAENALGDIYLTTFDHKLLRFSGNRFQQIPPPPVANPELGFQLYVDEANDLWVINPQFIGKLARGKWQEMISAAKLLENDQFRPRPALMAGTSRDGGVWIVTSQNLRKYRSSHLVFEARAPWRMESFWSLHEDSAGGVWITSSAAGLYHFSAEQGWQHFTTENALPYHSVRFVFEDREHNLWVGTSGGGLERFKRRYLINWGLVQGLPDRVVKSLSVDSQGRMYFGTWGKGVVRLDGTRITPVLRPHDTTLVSSDGSCRSFDGLVVSTLADHQGRLWVSTYSDGLFLVDGHRCQGFFASAGNSPQVAPLFEDAQGRIWAGTQDGVFSFDGTQFKKYLFNHGPEHSNVSSMAEDAPRRILWAGNQAGGLYRFDGERLAAVPEAQALANDRISALLTDSDGTLWIGTEDAGIACLRQGHLTRISEQQGMPARSIASIVDDGLGNLWFGSNRGILRASRKQLEDLVNGRKNRVEFQVFNQSDGMATTECSPETPPNAVKDPQGRLWFATLKGAVMVDPKNLRLNPQPPPLAIEQVLLDDQPAAARPALATSTSLYPLYVTVPPGDHRLEIHYAALSFTAPEKVRFRTLLEGFDKGWIEVGTRRVAYVQHMKPGQYSFRVQAANNDGIWNQAGTMAELYFKPHFYETYWFLAACVLGALAAGAWIHRWRLRGLQARALQLTELVDKRTRDLAKQRTFLQQILDINPSFIFAKDREGRFTLVNRALAEHFRSSPDALIGKTDADIQPRRREADSFRYDDLEVMNTLTERVIPEEPITDAEGRLHWLQTVKRPIVGEDGKAHQLLGVATDITERKRTEEELRRREAEYRRLVEDIPEVVWRTDEQGKVLLISPKIAKVFGYTVEEIYREGAKLWFSRIHPNERERVGEIYAQLFRENRPFDVEYRIQHCDGSWMWCHDRAVAIQDHPGGRCIAEGLLSDITARKLAEKELGQYREHLEAEVARRTAELTEANSQLRQEIRERQKLEEQLRQSQKMEAIGTLSGGIAHDFNNLLTVIKGYGRMVLDRVQHDPGLRHHVEQIDEAADRAGSLTTRLLAFSRRQMLQPKILNLNSLVVDLDKMLQRLIGENIEMVAIPAPDLGSIKADPGQLEQVIMNLVVNARDAMPNGGKLSLETASVELDEAYAREHVDVRPGRYVMLAVSDTGMGMDAETLSHIFEPFFTTKEQGRGTGLGLSMVYGIVKQSGGHIGVYSEPGHGTTFKVYFPRVDEEAQALPSGSMLAAADQGTGTILLVEDDRQVRELASSILTACGYSVLVAETARAALSVSEQQPGTIDLLLTDVVMPELSGRELANQVTARRPDIKVLYMSGYTTNAIVHHGVVDAGTFFLQKPFTPSSLARKVREVLNTPAGQASQPAARQSTA